MQTQKIVVSGLLAKDGKVLLAKRSTTKKIAPGKWHIPGGHAEFGEHPANALAREFIEELRFGINAQEVLAVHSMVENGVHSTIITYAVTSDDIPTVIDFDESETTEVGWFDQEEALAALDRDKHDYKTVKKYYNATV